MDTGQEKSGMLYRMYCGSAFVGVGTIRDTESGPVVKFRKMLAE